MGSFSNVKINHSFLQYDWTMATPYFNVTFPLLRSLLTYDATAYPNYIFIFLFILFFNLRILLSYFIVKVI